MAEFIPLYPEETEEAIGARWQEWANENVSPGDDTFVDTETMSMWWLCTRQGVREFARKYDLMGTEVVAAAFPQWAWGEYLDDHAEREGLTRNEETFAQGTVVFAGAAGTVIAAPVTVYVPAPDADTDPIEFLTQSGGTIPAAAAAPTGLTATALPVVNSGFTVPTGPYRYVVTALDAAGETVASAEVNASTAGTNNGIALNWNDVPTATSYRVYRKTGGAGPPYDLIATVTASAYTDSNRTITGAVIVPDATIHPPVANTTGGKLATLAIATEAGSAANVNAASISGVTPPITGVTVTNPAKMGGGADTESDEPLRVRVVGGFEDEGGANRVFYEKIALDYPGVGRVTVIPKWVAGAPNTVKVVVTDADGQAVSQAIVDGLQNLLDPSLGLGGGLAPVGVEVTVATATPLAVTVTSTVEHDVGYSLDGTGGTAATRALLTKAISDYLLTVQSGSEVVQRMVIKAEMGVPGVHDVTVVLTGAAANGNVAVGANPAQVPYLASLVLTEGAV